MADVKWDVEELSGNVQLLQRESENLAQYERFLREFKQTVAQNWQSQAGEMYQQRMDIEVQRMQLIREHLGNIIAVLRDVTNQEYTVCEEEIRQALGSI
ncbi:MAG: DUF3114 domain-containing protein [Provencibacterium sp.]|nr:DUF3114 domain-containing protein [Provencibacterium sp.]